MSSESNGSRRRWYQQFAGIFNIKPRSREDLEELLETAREENILDTEALDIIKGPYRYPDNKFGKSCYPALK